MRASALAGFLAALMLIGTIQVRTPDAQGVFAPELAEARFAPLASGSSAGVNQTNASASVAGSLVLLTTNVLYLNNTNASAPYFVKLSSYDASGISNVVSLKIGIHNGTAATAQIVGALGSLTQTSGAYVRLEPSSVNTIYVEQQVDTLGLLTSVVKFDVTVADDAAESAFYKMRAQVGVT